MVTEKQKIYTKKVYVTSDNKEYSSYSEAQKHENSLQPSRNILSHYRRLISDDREANIYKINSEEDLNYLEAVIWKYNAWIERDGLGWYIAFTNPGGDYDDDYDVMPLKKYLANLQDDIDELKGIYEN